MSHLKHMMRKVNRIMAEWKCKQCGEVDYVWHVSMKKYSDVQFDEDGNIEDEIHVYGDKIEFIRCNHCGFNGKTIEDVAEMVE